MPLTESASDEEIFGRWKQNKHLYLESKRTIRNSENDQ